MKLVARKPVSRTTSIALGIAIWVIFFGAWKLAVVTGKVNTLLVPPPDQVLITLYELITERQFLSDIGISILRIIGSFLGACLVAIPLGILMGTYAVAESFFNPFVSAFRQDNFIIIYHKKVFQVFQQVDIVIDN